MTRLSLSSIALLWALALAATQTHAEPAPVNIHSKFYYRIGGARSITAAPNPNVVTQTLGGSALIGLGYSCGKFDPTLGVTNVLNNLQNAGNTLINGAQNAVLAAIGSLPALILQRAYPGLYDLFQNALLRAETTISLATQSCEQMEREIARGGNPYEKWALLAKYNDWKVQMGAGGFGSANVDVKTALDNVEAASGTHGLPWLGGHNAGGKSQRPLRTVYDPVFAGYNITLNRAPDDPAPVVTPPTAQPAPLTELWDTPQDAAQWAVDVLGETLIRTYGNRPTESTPGHGLVRKISEEEDEVTKVLTPLIASSTAPDLADLRQISASDLLITREVIESLRELPANERNLAAGKLAQEAAMARGLEKAVFVRRLILAGRKEPNLDAWDDASDFITGAIADLDREIESVLFEKRVRKELSANTAEALLDIEAMLHNRSSAYRRHRDKDAKPVEDGAVAQ